MRILVVGAGIGGLTAAVALRRVGFEVHVYEQSNVLREVGAGVAVSPNAVKVLHRLDLADALGATGVRSLSLDSRDWQTGALLGRVPLGDAAVVRWGAPFYHLHRADLHNALRRVLGDEHITLGTRCVSVHQAGGSVTIAFADGRTATGDVVIGADGVHSVVRDYVAGPDRPMWQRQVSWRGLAPAALGREIGLEMRHHSFWGPGRQFVAFYVSGGRLVNWVGNTQSTGEWHEESWSARGDRDELLRLYAGWHQEVQALIAGTEHIFRWALFDRPPLAGWSSDRVTLLGDAAHPMLPYMAQGAGQSIEDAYVLAGCLLGDHVDPVAALRRYSDRRRGRTAAVQEASRQAARLVRLSDPQAVAERNRHLGADSEAPIARFDWIWNYDVEQGLTE